MWEAEVQGIPVGSVADLYSGTINETSTVLLSCGSGHLRTCRILGLALFIGAPPGGSFRHGL